MTSGQPRSIVVLTHHHHYIVVEVDRDDNTDEIKKLTAKMDQMSASLNDEVANLQWMLSNWAKSQSNIDKLR